MNCGLAIPAVGFRSMLAAGHPVEALFFAVAGHLRPGDRYESQKAGFSAAWFEFEDLISVALAKRRQIKLSSQGGRHGDAEKEAPSTPRGSEHVSDNELSDHEGNTLATPIKVAASTPACGSALVAPQTKDDDGEDNKIADQRREVLGCRVMLGDTDSWMPTSVSIVNNPATNLQPPNRPTNQQGHCRPPSASLLSLSFFSLSVFLPLFLPFLSLSSLCWIAQRLDSVTLLHICFPCHRAVRAHLITLPTHSRWLKTAS